MKIALYHRSITDFPSAMWHRDTWERHQHTTPLHFVIVVFGGGELINRGGELISRLPLVLRKWLVENCTDDFTTHTTVNSFTCIFDNADDALLFYMRFK